MESIWFYLEGRERRGPVTIEELIRVLLAAPEPRKARIWREGLADWQEAGAVQEISGKLPPPKPSVLQSNDANIPVPFAGAEVIAQLYRRLVLLVGLQIVFGLFVPYRTTTSSASLLGLVVSLLLICLLVTIAVTAYQLTSRLGESLPILWAIVMFIPCINIIGLLVISSNAQTWCRRYGIKVGLFGPTKESIEELRRRMQGGE